MTTQTTTNPAVAFMREGAQVGHWYLDGTLSDVTAEQAHYAPPGQGCLSEGVADAFSSGR